MKRRHRGLHGLLLSMLAVSAIASAANDFLIDDLGHAVAPQQLNGRWLLVTFGYTRCPDVCPTTLRRMDSALRLVTATSTSIEGYFVSVDPEHDTPAQLHRFLAGQTKSIHGLTGSVTAIDDARRTFGVPSRRNDQGFDHGVFVFLVAPNGQVTDTFHPNTSATQLAQAIRTRVTSDQRAHVGH